MSAPPLGMGHIPPGDLPDYEHLRRLIIAVTTTVLVLSTFSVFLRVLVRRKTEQSIMTDDFLMMLALLFSYIAIVGQYVGLAYGLAQHARNLTAMEKEQFQKTFFAVKIAYQPTEFCLKASILLFYTRIFQTRQFKRIAYGVLVATGMWAIATFFVNVFACIPVEFFWDKTINGTCSSISTNALATGAISFATDIIILCMPIPMIWVLKINRRQKIAVTGIFLLGSFVCVFSVLRFLALKTLNPKDFTYSQANAGIWTVLELSVGIICGNLPLLRPYFQKFFQSALSTGAIGSRTAQYGSNTGNAKLSSKLSYSHGGFKRMTDGKSLTQTTSNGLDSVSEIEMKGLCHGQNGLAQHGIESMGQRPWSPAMDPYEKGIIRVQTEIAVQEEDRQSWTPGYAK